MAYPKITVNTSKVLAVVASDTIPIPSPNAVPLSGTTTATTTNKLVDVGADFSNVVVGDIVYNTTDNTVATVSEVETSTILVLSANIFTSPEDYIVFQAGPIFEQRIDSSSGCLLYVGSNEATMDVAKSYVDVKVKTVNGDDIVFSNFPVGEYLPVQITNLFSTGTDAAARFNSVAIW
tara:strand:- start:96 stop:629 length:534 start_codon:yes stop_codon:yes gene_type:complete